MIHILHSIVTINSEYGGPARSVPLLCQNLMKNCDCNVSLLATKDENQSPAIQSYGVSFYNPQNQLYRSFLKAGQQILGNQTVEIIHDHGIWLPNNLAMSRLAKQNSIPIIISCRGMLSDWALQYKWLKKKVAWYIYQKGILEKANIIHATSTDEVDQIRNIGLTNPIALIPNIIETPDNLPDRNDNNKNVLFLSRIHPVKGLLTLINAWDQLSPENWTLNIAGPNEGDYQEVIEAEIKQLHSKLDIRFIGKLNNQEKWCQLSNADIFVLPSQSENFGVVIGEALASGIPVVATKSTPWKDIEDYKCGWWIDAGVESLVNALSKALSLSDEQRRGMGKNGKRLIAEKFNTQSICTHMISVYNWMINRNSKPDCILC